MTDEHRRIQELEAQVKQLKGDNDRFKRNLNQSVVFGHKKTPSNWNVQLLGVTSKTWPF